MISQRGARLETRNAQQYRIVVRCDSHFRKHGVLFQRGQLGVTNATALNPGEAFILAEQTQITPHLAFRVAMGHQQMLIVLQQCDICCYLALYIFFAVGAGDGRQRPIFQGNKG